MSKTESMNGDHGQGVTEIVVFRSNPGTAARARELTAKAVAEASRHGRIEHETLFQSHDDENLFVHQVRWSSLEDARRVAQLFPTFACAREFAEITAEPLVMGHFAAVVDAPRPTR